MLSLATFLVSVLRPHWRLAAAGLAGLLLLAAGVAAWHAHQRAQLGRRVHATLATQARHQAQATELRRRLDSTAAYDAGRLAELRNQATLLAHDDETLTVRRPAPVWLPARPPRE